MNLDEATIEHIMEELGKRFEAYAFLANRPAIYSPEAKQLVFVTHGDPFLVSGLMDSCLTRLKMANMTAVNQDHHPDGP